MVELLSTTRLLLTACELPCCTTRPPARSGPLLRLSHPIIWPSGIPSAFIRLRILHPIRASTLCDMSRLAHIDGPMSVLYL